VPSHSAGIRSRAATENPQVNEDHEKAFHVTAGDWRFLSVCLFVNRCSAAANKARARIGLKIGWKSRTVEAEADYAPGRLTSSKRMRSGRRRKEIAVQRDGSDVVRIASAEAALEMQCKL
jgi:hypothetical protein